MPPESFSLAAGVRPGDPAVAPVRPELRRGGRASSRGRGGRASSHRVLRVLRVRRDVLFWLGCEGFALTPALVTTLTPHRIWGACAAVGLGERPVEDEPQMKDERLIGAGRG
ncbi:hypothetical protein [Streptomyces sp. HD]|uniref:hypothetical protein n=1 Tax=Streptomyces sp. HD TaxID=3020892 RepID=UPI00232E54D8|nr:hypothetical protein [Streptomyces sp. HD]MDC0770401.1 hypothetical protein [Streptomyces sp. HD]